MSGGRESGYDRDGMIIKIGSTIESSLCCVPQDFDAYFDFSQVLAPSANGTSISLYVLI